MNLSPRTRVSRLSRYSRPRILLCVASGGEKDTGYALRDSTHGPPFIKYARVHKQHQRSRSTTNQLHSCPQPAATTRDRFTSHAIPKALYFIAL
eukprot:scaffold126310_cov57-Phaeocystis_antarctica.AAC.1